MLANSRKRRTSPYTSVQRRGSRSATTPATAPNSTAGARRRMNTPDTASSLAAGVLGSAPASAVVASSPSQSPKLDRPSAIHSRRKGVMARTARTSWSGASGEASCAVDGGALVLLLTTSAAYVRTPTAPCGRCAGDRRETGAYSGEGVAAFAVVFFATAFLAGAFFAAAFLAGAVPVDFLAGFWAVFLAGPRA